MSSNIREGRQDEADRTYAAWVAHGAGSRAVKAILPALVGPERAAQQARAWLGQHAMVGHGPPDPYEPDAESKAAAESQRLGTQAEQVLDSMLDRNLFAGHGAMFEPDDRYLPTGCALHEALDERMPDPGYPDARENTARIERSDIEQGLDRALASESEDEFNAYLGDLMNPDPYGWGNGSSDHKHHQGAEQ